MKRGVLTVCGSLAIVTSVLMTAPAFAAPCATAPVSVYTATGFSCGVGAFTFSDISIIATATGNASLTLTSLSPFVSGNEFGLQLNYLMVAGPSPPAGSADVGWSYNVTGTVPIGDALLQLVGNDTGTGVVAVNEQLSNGVSLSLNAPGSVTATFAPTTSLHVLKDQVDTSGIAGFATTSILVNAFSPVTIPVPEASTWVLLLTALAGLFGYGWREKRKAAEG